MNKNALRAVMVAHGETQADLAEAIGISPSRLSAKINGWHCATFSQNEIMKIKKHYSLAPNEIVNIFFAEETS